MKAKDIEYLRLAFKPTSVTLNGSLLNLRDKTGDDGYTMRTLGNGDYAVTISHSKAGSVIIK